MLVRLVNREDPDQTASSRPYGRQLVFKILEHLPDNYNEHISVITVNTQQLKIHEIVCFF